MKDLLSLPIGQQMDVKPKFITYTVYNVNGEKYEIDCTSDGWQSARVTREQLEQLVAGTLEFIDLDWK